MNINIISNDNGVGLSQDIDILTRLLTSFNHDITFTNFRDSPKTHYDLNIFLEVIGMSHFRYAKDNIIFPNPEYYEMGWKGVIRKFSKILCKSNSCLREFNKFHPKCIYTGFTSKDRYIENIPKHYDSFLHLAGRSTNKHTNLIASTWKNSPELPKLTIIQHPDKWNDSKKNSHNLEYIFDYLPEIELQNLQNAHGFHLCPSEVEGFGHYINEAMSCKAIVITTNASPMNELVNEDIGILVDSFESKRMNFGRCYNIKESDLKASINKALSLTLEDKECMSRCSREYFLNNDELFKNRIKTLFS